MAEDWAADVKKYAPTADDNIIAGIVRYCGIALTKRDSSLVSFSDKTELDRVRNNFLKKKLARTESDDVLDAAIAAVGDVMKADRTKNRVTVYYLLADKFDSLGLFLKSSNAKPKAPAKAAGAVATPPAEAKPAAKTTAAPAATPSKTSGTGAAATGGAALGLAAMSGQASAATPASANDAETSLGDKIEAKAEKAVDSVSDAAGSAGAAVVGAAGAAAVGAAALASKAGDAVGDAASGAAHAMSSGVDRVSGAASNLVDGDGDGSSNWLWWLLLGLLALFAIWWFFLRGPAETDAAPAPATTEAAAAAATTAASGATADLSVAPAEGTVAIPTGAGVTSELRDGKPVVKVYFDTAKTDVAAAFTGAAGGLKAWLDSHPGSSLAVSGFADPTGNAARNAELSKQRAQAVQAALVAAGIPEGSAELVKPDDSTDATVNKAAARRVEVVVR